MKYINNFISVLEEIDLFLSNIFTTDSGSITRIAKAKQNGVRENNMSTLCRAIFSFVGHCVPRRKFRKCRG
jgi:hypothetical protein